MSFDSHLIWDYGVGEGDGEDIPFTSSFFLLHGTGVDPYLEELMIHLPLERCMTSLSIQSYLM